MIAKREGQTQGGTRSTIDLVASEMMMSHDEDVTPSMLRNPISSWVSFQLERSVIVMIEQVANAKLADLSSLESPL